MSEPQTVVEHVPELAWYSADLFYDLSAIDAVILLVIAVGWSALIWASVEGIKSRLHMVKPYTADERTALTLLPILASMIFCVVALPFVVGGVSEMTPDPRALIAVGLVVGAACGLVSKSAHDLAGRFLGVVVARVLLIVGGDNTNTADAEEE